MKSVRSIARVARRRTILSGAQPAALGEVETESAKIAKRSGSYSLGIFLLINILLNIDRSVLSVVLEPIKREFAVPDAQMGLLHLAFAVFFGVCGVPLGRLVDRSVRRNVLAGCVGVFSLATGSAAMAANFVQLLCARLLVGAGEAAGAPAMLSMISDLFPDRRRASAISVYYLGVPIASVLVFLVGGHLAGALGWRSVFIAAAAPGVPLALLTLLTLREPEREVRHSLEPTRSLSASLSFLLSQPALLHIFVTAAINALLQSAITSWAVSFLIRSHHLQLSEASLLMAITFGAIGGVGALAGGELADALGQKDMRWRGWICAIAALLACPTLILFLCSSSMVITAIALALWSIWAGLIYSPVLALVQSLSPRRTRGTASAIFYMLANFAGVGTGPLIVGAMSDWLRPSFGADSLRYSMAAASLLYLWTASHYLMATKTLLRDISRCSADELQ